MKVAHLGSMLTIGVSLAGLGALGFVVYQLRKAPEGYEDERGFHFINRTPGSKVMRSPKASGSLASLRSAKASR
jgi:hypothetical protein